MEQYAHLLIPADSEFVPPSEAVSGFFELAQKECRFEYVQSQRDWTPGLRAFNSAERIRVGRDPYTGEETSVKIPKIFELEQTSEIPAFIAGEPKWGVMMSGKWTAVDLPIPLVTCDESPFAGDFICDIKCQQRAHPVCTGDWWGEERGGTANSALTIRAARSSQPVCSRTHGRARELRLPKPETHGSGSNSNLGSG